MLNATATDVETPFVSGDAENSTSGDTLDQAIWCLPQSVSYNDDDDEENDDDNDDEDDDYDDDAAADADDDDVDKEFH